MIRLMLSAFQSTIPAQLNVIMSPSENFFKRCFVHTCMLTSMCMLMISDCVLTLAHSLCYRRCFVNKKLSWCWQTARRV